MPGPDLRCWRLAHLHTCAHPPLAPFVRQRILIKWLLKGMCTVRCRKQGARLFMAGTCELPAAPATAARLLQMRAVACMKQDSAPPCPGPTRPFHYTSLITCPRCHIIRCPRSQQHLRPAGRLPLHAGAAGLGGGAGLLRCLLHSRPHYAPAVLM